MPPASKPWKPYKVGAPSTNTGWSVDCQPFDEVSHVSHIESALRIVEDRKIKQGLVFDESILNTERVLVSWLSPNSWAYGYRYGNVRFTFDFASLVKGKKYYWVEVITKYKPPALRILVTTEDHSARLTPYDPEKGDGPWWYDSSNDKHYYNGAYTLEFMFEQDLPIRELKKVDFVQHHSDYCSVHRTSPNSCSEIGMHGSKAGARFLAMAAGRGVSLQRLRDTLVEEDNKLSDRTTDALGWIALKLRKVVFTQQVKSSSDTGHAVARAVLNALAANEIEDAQLLASLFWSYNALVRALAAVVGKSLDWDDTGEIRSAMD
ncbi:hypothetical protein SNE35_29730 [Paucibacter sp. R3-3]|uniref:Uncharacterized protein n=1 Tax=Roseateles agri TaxID=3098619 RepID=A0ABU5DQX3_9BURK|nr:hypothetical protein [Paucibacter sp. R3-3]MDY0748716.1 hypothetical protein [Paucibacter sp. R3-3]